MIVELLQRAGVLCEETAFLRQPEGTFAVWGEKITPVGSDYGEEVYEHEVLVELYENPDFPDETGREIFRDALKEAYKNGEIEGWHSEMRVWLEDVRLFLTSFHVEYFERSGRD